MAYLDYTRPDSSNYHKLTLCLTDKECKLLLPSVKTRLKKAENKYEKYRDIIEGGEASEKQQTLYFEAEDEVNTMENIKKEIESFLNR